MKSRQEYEALLCSLEAGKQTIEADGLKIELRNCYDRKAGQMDPRTAFASRLTQEEYHKNRDLLDPELLANEVHLFGPEGKETMDPLSRLRQEFGWRSSDLSTGVRTTSISRGSYTIWQYEVPTAQKERPCVVFIHGGGYFGGDIPTVENQCKLLAQRTGGVVLSVDYPLAPENPFPAGFDACYDTISWAWENADALGISRSKIGAAGDSAGGNLSLVCALRDKAEGKHMLSYLGLIYPNCSMEESVGNATWWKPGDYDDPEEDPVIQAQIRVIGSMDVCRKWYMSPGQDFKDPYVSPIYGDFKGLPKTKVFTAEYDFLRAECQELSKRLEAAGVEHKHIRYGGIFHGTFDRLGYAPQVEDIVDLIAADMNGL